MTQDRATPNGNGEVKALHQKVLASSHYGLLGLHPSASVREIRQAYRDLSKLYHPDTTALSSAIATTKFQQLNEAYATLSSPERRTAYDLKLGYARVPVVSVPRSSQPTAQPRTVQSSSAYLDPTDRPLSPGEVFALFILGLTFVGCLVLAIAIGITRGEAVLQPVTAQNYVPGQAVTAAETSVSPASVSKVAPGVSVSLPSAPVLDSESQAVPTPPTGDRSNPSEQLNVTPSR